MKLLLSISVLLQFLAFFWAVHLARRESDWRFVLLAVAMGIIAFRRLLILLTGSPFMAFGPGPFSEIPGLILGGVTLSAIIALDHAIDERRRAEVQLRFSHQQLRELGVRLNHVREEERSTISREIHDEIGQVMTGLKIELKLFHKQVQTSHPHLLSRIQEMLHLTDRTMLAMRDIATELRPSALDNLGLVAAIEWQAEKFQQRSGIRCSVQANFDDERLDSNLATAAFRIFQESLVNVLRHSEATNVKISLSRVDGNLLMTICDNGLGLSANAFNKPESLGIVGMRERALPFSGKVDIRNAAEGGTMVSLSIPLIQQG